MDENRTETINGIVSAVVFKNDENGYTVARVKLGGDAELVLVGTMPFLGCGEQIEATGVYVSHQQYGRQFQVASYMRSMPADLTGIYDYLASRTVWGIGPKTARLIVDTFGIESFDVIAEQPERLCSLRGITREKARTIQASFLKQNSMRHLIEFLASHALPAEFAAPLLMLFGGEAVQAVKENPYTLCEPPFDADFGQIDTIGRALGIADSADCRLDAAILYELSYNLQNGHVFIPQDKLLAVSAQLCGASESALEERLVAMNGAQRVICENLFGISAVYLPHAHSAEEFLARDAARLLRMKLIPPDNLPEMLEKMQIQAEVRFNDLQLKAVASCFSGGVSLITGGPGTGKTTALKVLVRSLEACGFSVLLAAPTGRAAKAMENVCGKEAKTIHRLLEAAFGDKGELVFSRNAANPLVADVVVVDEASMLDIFLASSLLRAFKPHTRIVLVGDSDQLPPIGPGNFFSDLLDTLPHVRLVEIFRQAQGSDIIMNAHAINRGEQPELKKNDNDFYFVTARSADSTVSTIITLISERIPARFGISTTDIQVICQSRQMVCGTVSLNRHLQHALNPASPQKGEIAWGSVVFRAGDRVMQVRNNYDRPWHRVSDEDGFSGVGAGVYNGDIGNIIFVDRSAGVLSVVFDDKQSEYSTQELDELEHAYAITAHKAQGSEYAAVVIPVFSAPSRLLNRNLLYTAVTRAKKHLTMVGREQMVLDMIASNKKNKRYAALRTRLKRELDK